MWRNSKNLDKRIRTFFTQLFMQKKNEKHKRIYGIYLEVQNEIKLKSRIPRTSLFLLTFDFFITARQALKISSTYDVIMRQLHESDDQLLHKLSAINYNMFKDIWLSEFHMHKTVSFLFRWLFSHCPHNLTMKNGFNWRKRKESFVIRCVTDFVFALLFIFRRNFFLCKGDLVQRALAKYFVANWISFSCIKVVRRAG